MSVQSSLKFLFNKQSTHVKLDLFKEASMLEHVHMQTFCWLSLSLVSRRQSRVCLWVTSLSVWSLNVRWVLLSNLRRWLLWAGLKNWVCSDIKHWISNVRSSNLGRATWSTLSSMSWNNRGHHGVTLYEPLTLMGCEFGHCKIYLHQLDSWGTLLCWIICFRVSRSHVFSRSKSHISELFWMQTASSARSLRCFWYVDSKCAYSCMENRYNDGTTVTSVF